MPRRKRRGRRKAADMVVLDPVVVLTNRIRRLTSTGLAVLDRMAATFMSNCDQSRRLRKQESIKIAYKKLIKAEMVFKKIEEMKEQGPDPAMIETLAAEIKDQQGEVIDNAVGEVYKVLEENIQLYVADILNEDLEQDNRFSCIVENLRKASEIAQVTGGIDYDSDDGYDSENSVIIPDLDPVSNRPLDNPVRNSICKHIYNRDTMVQRIQQNQRGCRCPTFGCKNRKLVKVEHLVQDLALEEKIKKQKYRFKKKRR